MTDGKPAAEDAAKTVPATVDLFNVNDGLIGRNGGPYLDEVMHRRDAEIAAKREGRKFEEKDLQNGSPAVQLVTPAQLVTAHRVASPASPEEITSPKYGEIGNPAVAANAQQKALDEENAIRAAGRTNENKKK